MRVTGPGLLLLATLLTCGLPAAAVGQTCVAQCTADCDDGGTVTVDKLLKAVVIALSATHRSTPARPPLPGGDSAPPSNRCRVVSTVMEGAALSAPGWTGG